MAVSAHEDEVRSVLVEVVSLRTCVITLCGDHGVSMRERVAEEMQRTTGIPHLIVDLRQTQAATC